MTIVVRVWGEHSFSPFGSYPGELDGFDMYRQVDGTYLDSKQTQRYDPASSIDSSSEVGLVDDVASTMFIVQTA